MTPSRILLCSLVLSAGMTAALAESPVGGLTAGFTVDVRSNSIRPVYGIPGAQTLGTPIALDFSVAQFVASPNGRFGLAVSATNRVYIVRNLFSAEPQAQPTDVTVVDPNSLTVTDDTAAAFDETGVAVLWGLPDRTDLVAHFALPNGALPSNKDGANHSLALNAKGKMLLAGLGDGTTGGVYWRGWGPSGPESSDVSSDGWNLVQSLGAPAGVAFLPDGNRAVVLDGAAPAVWLLRGLTTGRPEQVQLAGAADGLSMPAKMLYLAGSGRISVATAKSILLLDTERGDTPGRIPLPVMPSKFQLLNRDSIVLNEADEAPMYALDLSSAPNIYFIPAN